MRQSLHGHISRPARLAILLCALILLPLAAAQDEAELPPPKPPQPDFTGKTPFEIVDIESGNTLIVQIEGKPTTIRLIGTYIPRSCAAEAKQFIARMLRGEQVFLSYEPDWPLRDREDRVWAYVYRAPDGLFANCELVRQGYARVSAAGPFEHRELLDTYERLARRIKKGLWKPSERESEAAPAGAAEPAGPAEPAVGPAEPAAEPGTQVTHVQSDTRQADDVTTVYVTEHGKKYHRKGCRHLRGGGVPMSLQEARERGFTPCKTCDPPP